MFVRAQKAVVASAAVFALAAAAHATPTVLNFDDLPSSAGSTVAPVPQQYGSDSWDWGSSQFFVEGNQDYQSFYLNTNPSSFAPSPSNAIGNTNGDAVTQVSRTFPFNFQSLELSSFIGLNTYQQTSATVLTIQGLRLGVVVGSKTVALDTAYHDVVTNWRDVDTIRFTASGSMDTQQASGGYFLTDNFAYTPVQLGDANDSGKVDFSDLLTLDQNYNQSGKHWEQGDFNNDGSVGFDDLLILAQHYGDVENAAQFASLSPAFQQDVAAAFAQVPEPASASLLALVGLGLLSRRRKIVQ